MQSPLFDEPEVPSRTAAAASIHRNRRDAWRKAISVFDLHHLWAPLAAFVLLSAWLMGAYGDQWLADRLYALEGHAWTLQFDYFTQDLLHVAGREASKVAWYAVLLMWLASLPLRGMSRWRTPLLYLLVSTLLAIALVAWMKRWTQVDCPWDLIRYGGQKTYVGLFATRPSGVAPGKCFPAGHASAGYAWVALYFFFLRTRPQWRWWGLGIALTVGLAFGFAQQLRGAHFLSHDVWALMICWLVALGLSGLMLAPDRRPASSGQMS